MCLTISFVQAQEKPSNFDAKMRGVLKEYESIYNILVNSKAPKSEKVKAAKRFKELFDGTSSLVWNDLDTTSEGVNFIKASQYFKDINNYYSLGHSMKFSGSNMKIGGIIKNYERNSLTTSVKITKKISFRKETEVIDSITVDSTIIDTTVTLDSTIHSHKDTIIEKTQVPYEVYIKFDIENGILIKPQIYAISKVGKKPQLKPIKGDDKWWVELPKEWKTYFVNKLKMPEFPDKYDFGKLSYLTKIDLSKESFSDITPLQRLDGLQKLNLSKTQVSDLSPLAELKSLRELDVSESQVRDLSALKNLTNLQVLKCNKLEITSIDPLSGMVNLIEFEVRENEIENIDAVKNMVLLEKFDFSLNLEIKTIEPLRGLENLTNVRFAKMKVKDLSPLSNCYNLVELDCFNNEITSLAPVKKCYKMTNLNIGYNKIYTLDEIAGMRYIMELEMKGAPVKDISVLKTFINLRKLVLSETWVEDIGPIMNCEELLYLTALDSKIPKGQIARFKKKYPDAQIYYIPK